MIKTLFWEIYCNISNREIERQIRYNILYRYFLSLSFYDKEVGDLQFLKNSSSKTALFYKSDFFNTLKKII